MDTAFYSHVTQRTCSENTRSVELITGWSNCRRSPVLQYDVFATVQQDLTLVVGLKILYWTKQNKTNRKIIE